MGTRQRIGPNREPGMNKRGRQISERLCLCGPLRVGITGATHRDRQSFFRRLAIMRKIIFWAIAVIALLQVGVSAVRAAEPLEFKAKGDWFIDVIHVGKQDISVAGNNQQSETHIHMVFKAHVTKSDEAGAEIEHTIVAEDDTITSGLQ